MVEKLVEKATDVPGSTRLKKTIEELLEVQEKAEDAYGIGNKLWKFKKTKEKEAATSLDYKNMAADLREHVALLLTETKAVRALMPKDTPTKTKDK